MTTNSSSMSSSADDPEGSNDKYLQSLEKQLTIEMKVKNGTENMIQSISQNYQSRDKKLLAEAYTMLDDSKAKIEFLKLKILKVKQNRQMSKVRMEIFHFPLVAKFDSQKPFFLSLYCSSVKAASENGELKSNEQLESSLEERIEELRHRLRIEAAVVDGAKNVIRTLQSNKTIDKKALQEVSSQYLSLSLFDLALAQILKSGSTFFILNCG